MPTPQVPVRDGWIRGHRFSSLVDSPDPELVDGPFDESRVLADRGFSFGLGADLPLLVLLVSLLDDVAGDGAAAVELGLVPLELDPVGVEVNNLIGRAKIMLSSYLAFLSLSSHQKGRRRPFFNPLTYFLNN